MIEGYSIRLRAFEVEAHKLFGVYEKSASRVVDARASLARVTALSVSQEDILKQAIRCVEVEVYRGAHVLAFAAFVDYLQELAGRDNFSALNAARPKSVVRSVGELREQYTEHGFIEAMNDAGFIDKNQKKAFHGMLTRRNECAHPSDYYPDMNQSLGFISEVLGRVETLKKQHP